MPGGAFRTFWEPEYKMSMPVGGVRVLTGQAPQPGSLWWGCPQSSGPTVLGEPGAHHASGVCGEGVFLQGQALPCGVGH